jgi:hypothetical protein
MPQEDLENKVEAIICSFNCSEQNIQRCRKCNRPFCVMHASRFSPNFCQDCFKNVSIVEDKFSRTFDDYDVKNDKVVIRKESCTRWYIDGPDWPFLNLWIDNLSDDELRIIWNFHFFVMKTIEAENETRKIEKYRKLREAPVPRLMSQTIKTGKGLRKVTSQKTPETPEEMRKRLTKMNLPANVIDMMVAQMTKGA